MNGLREDVCIIWAGPSLLACTTNDLSIRFWDIESGNSYIITAPTSYSSFPKQTFVNISYSNEKGNYFCNSENTFTIFFHNLTGLLCAATNLGSIIIWHFDEEIDDQWNIQGSCKIQDSIKYCVWGPLNLAVYALNGIYVLREHALLASCKEEVAAVQTSANNLNIFHCSTYESCSFNTDFQVIGLALTKEHICLWNGKYKFNVYNYF